MRLCREEMEERKGLEVVEWRRGENVKRGREREREEEGEETGISQWEEEAE